jgi:hypothetical protein
LASFRRDAVEDVEETEEVTVDPTAARFGAEDAVVAEFRTDLRRLEATMEPSLKSVSRACGFTMKLTKSWALHEFRRVPREMAG